MSELNDSPSLEKPGASSPEVDGLALFECYHDVVCRFTLHHLREKGCDARSDHSEDIISSAWLAILEHYEQLRDREKIEVWINTIILNLVNRHVSGPKGCISNQRNRDSMEAAEEARIERAEKMYHDRLLANEIRMQADARSSKFAAVMSLYIEEEYTMEEIAEKLGESPAKLRSMYYRNMSHLRELFKDEGDDGDDPAGH